MQIKQYTGPAECSIPDEIRRWREASAVRQRVPDSRDPIIQAIRGRMSGAARRARTLERDQAIIGMRRRGATYRAIGARFRLSHVAAWKVCARPTRLRRRAWLRHPRPWPFVNRTLKVVIQKNESLKGTGFKDSVVDVKNRPARSNRRRAAVSRPLGVCMVCGFDQGDGCGAPGLCLTTSHERGPDP